MRWTIRTAAASLALAAVVVLGPAPLAFAAQPPPGTVDPIPDLPSRIVKMTQSSSGTYVLDLLGLMAAANRETALAPIPKPPPATPLTSPATWTRGAGGVAMMAFQAGWGLGQGGLAMYAAATGDTYENLSCNQPDWYQGVNSLMTFGLAPGCAGTVANPQPGSMITGGTLVFGGLTFKIHAVSTGRDGSPANSPTGTGYCATWSGNPGSGYGAGWRYPSGYQSMGSWWGGVVQAGTLAPCGPSGTTIAWRSTSPAPYYYVYNAQGEVARSSEVKLRPLADSTRTPRCKIDWEDGTSTTGTGTAYTENGGIPMSAAGLGCEQAFVSKPGGGPALLPSRITVESEDEAGAKTTISDQQVPDYGPDERRAFDATKSAGLVLTKVVNGVSDSCNTWAADCAGWWAQSDQGTNQDTYRCLFGGQAVSLAECGIYRYTFDTKTSTPTITDPTTGQQVPWSSTARGNNSTSPGGSGDVGPGQQCMDEWSSAPNPIEWVFHPIKCALVWAFVPRASVTDNFRDGIGSAWNNSTVGAMAVSLSGLPAIFSTEAGCAGLPFDIDFFGIHFQGRLFEACSEPWAGVATVVRNIISGVILVGGFLAILRYGAGVFGFVGLGLGVGDHDTHETKGVRFK